MSAAEQTPDERVAKALGIHAEQVSIARERWNTSPDGTIVRAVLRDRLEQLFAERQRKLRKVSEQDLKSVQGEMDALELAIAIITNPITTT